MILRAASDFSRDSDVARLDQNDSSAWHRASSPVFLATSMGREATRSGSRILRSGRQHG